MDFQHSVYALILSPVDWEHPTDPAQGCGFVKLLTALRGYLPRPRYIVTAALPANQDCLSHIDLAYLTKGSNPILDHINLMAYDFSGSWSASSGHHAQLYAPPNPKHNFEKQCVDKAVRYLLEDKNVTAQRIVLGIPTYGRSFLGVQDRGQRFSACGGEEGTREYRDLPLQGYSETIDPRTGSTSCRGSQGSIKEWITYDSPETVQSKAEFVRANNLGGIFFWTGASDADKDERSLIVAAHNALCSSRISR